MIKPNIKNEKIKRSFFSWLKEANGNCDSTIGKIENAVVLYEEFTKYAEFNTFSPDKAVEFKKWLRLRKHKENSISLVTYHAYLRSLRKFFTWLCSQPGYKSKINTATIQYLNISEKEERIATQQNIREFPQLDYVRKLTDSIQISNEIDQRDRAMISFALLTGMRDQAIITLPLGCFDEEKKLILQDPRLGVQTKFSKLIPSILFKFDEKLYQYFLEWVIYLKNKGFTSKDPLFPRSKSDKGENNLSFEPATEIIQEYWQGTGRIRDIFKTRAEKAGLSYFPPHTFRHLAVDLALKNCKTGEEIKAVSQNFGHENIATTLSSYSNFDHLRLRDILNNIDFSGKPVKSEKDLLEEILNKMNKQEE